MSETFESWGIVEIMGHKIYAGKLGEQVIAGAAFLRVDVPAVDGIAGYTKFFGAGSIYAITPTDEATAKAAATRLRERPVSVYILPALAQSVVDRWESAIDNLVEDEPEENEPVEEEDDEAENEPLPDSAKTAADWAYAVLQNFSSLRVLDLETTGLESGSEPVSIAVINGDGVVLLDTLVKPSIPIPAEASAIHGITDDMVADAPSFADVWPKLIEALGGVNEHGNPNSFHPVVIYNKAFDVRVLQETARNIGEQMPPFNWQCAMEHYAQFWGEWNSRRGSYVWQRLGNALMQQGIELEGTAHTALDDCRATLSLVRKMAEKSLRQAAT